MYCPAMTINRASSLVMVERLRERRGDQLRRAVAAALLLALVVPVPALAKGKKPPEVRLYPTRPDAQKKDRERKIGQGVELSGWTMTVKSAAYKPNLGTFDTDGYAVVTVALLNRDKKSQSWSTFEYRLLTPQGQVVDPAFTSLDGALTGGTLVNGAKQEGPIVFKVGKLPKAKGRYYVLWKPDGFNDDRGVWAIDI